MNTSSNGNPGFILKLFRRITRTITHPCAAWFMFLLLVIYSGAIMWGMRQFLESSTELLSLRLEFDRHLLKSQEEILEKLQKALKESGDSQ